MEFPSGAGRQALPAADLYMLRIHDFLQSLGHAGLLCQTQVWCAGRVEEARLRAALAALCRRYPVMQSRLVRGDRRNRASWVFTGGPGLPLHVHELPESSEAAVLRFAERLLVTPPDLGKEPPLEFHLLRRPGAGDVLLLQFCHALMDGRSPELLLAELEQLARTSDAGPEPAAEEADPLVEYLARFSRWRRFRSFLQMMRQAWRHRGEAMTIALPDLPRWVLGPPRIALRSLAREDTQHLCARLRKLCGFESIAAALLASSFRATAACASRRYSDRTRCRAFVPLNMRQAGDLRPIFRNMMSVVTVSAARAELADRDGLAKDVNAQVRNALRRGEDLGVLQSLWLSRRQGALGSKPGICNQTFGFSFHGRAVAGFDSLCGATIERLFTLGEFVYPPGVFLQANQLDGRLHLSLVYTAGAVPESVGNAFLDTVAADLLTANPGPVALPTC
jgi:hypothetical protein